MLDEQKTKAELLQELETLRRRTSELEQAEQVDFGTGAPIIRLRVQRQL